MYLQEFRLNARSLVAACLGMGMGSALNHYAMSLFGPALIAEFGWSRADFALVGSLSLINLLLMPVAGWFIDRFGTRISAMVGFTALTLGLVALSMMTGSLIQFFAILIVLNAFGGLSSSLVFCKIAVEKFDVARGLALSMVMAASPLGGGLVAPLLGEIIDAEGWRTAYRTLALIAATGGVISVTLMKSDSQARAESRKGHGVSWSDARQFLRNPVLILIMAGMFMVNIPQVFSASQLKLIAMDSGMISATATWMISLYATGVIVGRFICGAALDRIPAHYVALASLGLPAIGYLVFASSITAVPFLGAAVLIIGLAQGAEGDIGAYLLSRHFDIKNFSLLLSLLTAMLASGGAIGSVILSITLRIWGGYEIFLVIAAVSTLIGAVLFGLTGYRWSKNVSAGEIIRPASERSR